MDPLALRASHRVTDSIDADSMVMIASNREDGRDVAQLADQLTQLVQLGCAIQQIAPQQHGVCLVARYAIHDLLAQHIGTAVPQVNIAYVHDPARIMPCGNAFFAEVERVGNPDLKPA
jgi:hypothetical protein